MDEDKERLHLTRWEMEEHKERLNVNKEWKVDEVENRLKC